MTADAPTTMPAELDALQGKVTDLVDKLQAQVTALKGQCDVLLELVRGGHAVLNQVVLHDDGREDLEALTHLVRQMRTAINDTDVLRRFGR